jgi:predicted GNAT family acetyltransferase
VHLADAESSTAEIAGVGTLPAYRRRGLASAVTAALAIDAFDRGIEVVWLSAADVDVAAMYARIGFRRVGTYVISSKP